MFTHSLSCMCAHPWTKRIGVASGNLRQNHACRWIIEHSLHTAWITRSLTIFDDRVRRRPVLRAAGNRGMMSKTHVERHRRVNCAWASHARPAKVHAQLENREINNACACNISLKCLGYDRLGRYQNKGHDVMTRQKECATMAGKSRNPRKGQANIFFANRWRRLRLAAFRRWVYTVALRRVANF